jgi:hypothetical protein
MLEEAIKVLKLELFPTKLVRSQAESPDWIGGKDQFFNLIGDSSNLPVSMPYTVNVR